MTISAKVNIGDSDIYFEKIIYKDLDAFEKISIVKMLECIFGKVLKEKNTLEECFGYIAKDKNIPKKKIGIALLKEFKCGTNSVYLSKFGICPAYAGNGFGAKLLNEVKTGYGNYDAIYLRTDNKNLDAKGNPVSNYYVGKCGAKEIADIDKFDAGGKALKISINQSAHAIDNAKYISEICAMEEDFYRKSEKTSRMGERCLLKPRKMKNIKEI